MTKTEIQAQLTKELSESGDTHDDLHAYQKAYAAMCDLVPEGLYITYIRRNPRTAYTHGALYKDGELQITATLDYIANELASDRFFPKE